MSELEFKTDVPEEIETEDSLDEEELFLEVPDETETEDGLEAGDSIGELVDEPEQVGEADVNLDQISDDGAMDLKETAETEDPYKWIDGCSREELEQWKAYLDECNASQGGLDEWDDPDADGDEWPIRTRVLKRRR